MEAHRPLHMLTMIRMSKSLQVSVSDCFQVIFCFSQKGRGYDTLAGKTTTEGTPKRPPSKTIFQHHLLSISLQPLRKPKANTEPSAQHPRATSPKRNKISGSAACPAEPLGVGCKRLHITSGVRTHTGHYRANLKRDYDALRKAVR